MVANGALGRNIPAGRCAADGPPVAEVVRPEALQGKTGLEQAACTQ